jgi:tRNA(Arg) A34 adenosine deaminase TadA
LALHLGVKEIRILDAVNYKPDFAGYEKVGLHPAISNHPKIAALFRKWVRDPKNTTIWNRDIGIWNRKHAPPFDVKQNRARVKDVMAITHRKAREAFESGEAPIGAVVIDPLGEILGCGHSMILKDNDPSMVAAMSAWRACGARDHWKDKTLFLTAGPDTIAYGMFHIFNFGQLVVASDRFFGGQTAAVRKLGVPTHVLGDVTSDKLLKEWIRWSSHPRVAEYLGATYAAK